MDDRVDTRDVAARMIRNRTAHFPAISNFPRSCTIGTLCSVSVCLGNMYCAPGFNKDLPGVRGFQVAAVEFQDR